MNIPTIDPELINRKVKKFKIKPYCKERKSDGDKALGLLFIALGVIGAVILFLYIGK